MQYPEIPEGTNPKAMAKLVYRLAFVACNYPTSSGADHMQTYHATLALLGYEPGVALRGNGDYSYDHYFPTLVCASCGNFVRNHHMQTGFFLTGCSRCVPYLSSIRRADKKNCTLHMSTLSNLPEDVAYELKLLIAKEEREYFFGD